MSRFRTSSEDNADEQGVDISPLIDVVFILLIFFIVTTVFVEESGVVVNKPEPSQAQPSENETIVLVVTEQGKVLHEGREIGLSGVQPLVKRALRKKQAPVIVQAETNATTGRLVSVLDEAKLAGAEKVSIASRASG